MVALLMDAAARRRAEEHNGRVLLAWNIDMFRRAKRLTKADLNRLIVRHKRTPQTTEQMRDIARMITAYHGGTVH